MNLAKGTDERWTESRTRLVQTLVRLCVVLAVPFVVDVTVVAHTYEITYLSLSVGSAFWFLEMRLGGQIVYDYLGIDSVTISLPDSLSLAQMALVIMPSLYFFLRYSHSGYKDELRVAGITLVLNSLVLVALQPATASSYYVITNMVMDMSMILSGIGTLSMLLFVVLPTAGTLFGGSGSQQCAPEVIVNRQSRWNTGLTLMRLQWVLVFLGLLLPTRVGFTQGGSDIISGYSECVLCSPLLLIGTVSRTTTLDYYISGIAMLAGMVPYSGVAASAFALATIDTILGWLSVLYLSRRALMYGLDAGYRRAFWKSVGVFCVIASGGYFVGFVTPFYYYRSFPIVFPVFVLISLVWVRFLRSRSAALLGDRSTQGALEVGLSGPELMLRALSGTVVDVVEVDVKVPLYYVAVSKLKRRLRKSE